LKKGIAMLLTPETIERLLRDRTAHLPLSADDRAAVLAQAPTLLTAVAALDELPLDTVEPAAVFKVIPPAGNQE
jgi:hypothetical protein